MPEDDAPKPDLPRSGDDATDQGGPTDMLAFVDNALRVGGGSLPGEDDAKLSPDTDHIGPYRILELLGEGGMGSVYKAEQRQPIKRTVALKVIKLGFGSREVIARFESERQALAMMDHPNIARVLDAGSTGVGRPYFVMEYVPGRPITRFCDDNKLSIHDRLTLFLQVCGAIAHAHTKAILHRDIKSGNVLAYLSDGKPTVKVIDFGIAKALSGERLTDRTLVTAVEQVVGTYDTMSPEQAEGSPDIDTRTDVYSLGVLLYELLTGSKPFDPETLARAAKDERRRIIREVEPPRPSTKLSELGETGATIAAARQARLDALTYELRSELEWIPLKAMRKERDRRYQSVLELSQDVENYLAGRALIAGPESKAYRFRKFLARNRASVIATLLIVGLLVGGVAATTWQAIRAARAEGVARRNEQEAQRQAQEAKSQQVIAEAVSGFLTEMLNAADPEHLLGDKVTVLQASQKAIERLDAGALKEQPLTEAAVRHTIGVTLLNLSRLDEAEPQIRKALDLRRKVAGPTDQATAATTSDLALLLQNRGRFPEAESLLREAVQSYRALPPSFTPQLSSALDTLASTLQFEGKFDEAERIYRESLDIARKLAPSGDATVALRLQNLASLYAETGKPADAEPLVREALSIQERTLPPGHLDIASSYHTLGVLLSQQNKLPETEAAQRKALEIFRAGLPAEHTSIATAMNNLALTLKREGKLAEAEELLRDAVAMRRKLLAPDSAETITATGNLAGVLAAQKRHDEAIALFREALAQPHDDSPAALMRTAQLQSAICTSLRATNQLEEAETLLREALATYKKLLPANHPTIKSTTENLAAVLEARGKGEEAAQLRRSNP